MPGEFRDALGQMVSVDSYVVYASRALRRPTQRIGRVVSFGTRGTGSVWVHTVNIRLSGLKKSIACTVKDSDRIVVVRRGDVPWDKVVELDKVRLRRS